MVNNKTIICLANSRKPPSGWCIAGREFDRGVFGNWVRPVSARPTREISEQEREYKDGDHPRVLDIVTIPIHSQQPMLHQQENYIIDDKRRWQKLGVVQGSDLQSAVENPNGPLWIDGYSSSRGLNDRVPMQQLAELTRSLYLIRPDNLALVIASEPGSYGPRRRVRARFDLCGYPYCIVVTDPWIENQSLSRNDGEYAISDALVCVSLGEVFYDHAYKLAASIIVLQQTEG